MGKELRGMEETTKIKIHTEQIKGVELRNLCSTFLDAILQFYEDPDNRRKFQEWKVQREHGTQNIAPNRRDKKNETNHKNNL